MFSRKVAAELFELRLREFRHVNVVEQWVINNQLSYSVQVLRDILC